MDAEIWHDGYKSAVMARFAYAQEQEAPETDSPGDDQRCKQQRTQVWRVCKCKCHHDNADIGGATRQVEEAFGLQEPCRYKQQPLERKNKQKAQAKQGPA